MSAKAGQAHSTVGLEADDAYSGGPRPGNKRGRGAAGKTPFVAIVETTAERKPRRLRLTVIKGFRKREIKKLAKRDFATGNAVTDGLSCWTAVTTAGCDHFPMVTGTGTQAVKWVPFTWGQHGTRQHQNRARRHLPPHQRQAAQRYFASYAWRFNYRYQLDTLTERFLTPAHGRRRIPTGSSLQNENKG